MVQWLVLLPYSKVVGSISVFACSLLEFSSSLQHSKHLEDDLETKSSVGVCVCVCGAECLFVSIGPCDKLPRSSPNDS